MVSYAQENKYQMDQELQKCIKAASAAAANLKLVPPVSSGSFDGSRTGSGTGGAMEFADYRAYRAGDELRRVDWRLYARSEQLMVRRFAQETSPRCDIILDFSRSMEFYGKKAAMLGMGAFFAKSALNANFSLQVWGIGDALMKMTAPGEPELWEVPAQGGRKEPFPLFEELRSGLFRNGVRILISDLFFNMAPGELMKNLGGGNVIILQVLGAEELFPSLSGAVTVTDPESGANKVIHVDSSALERYREELGNFQSRYVEVARSHNASIFFLNGADVVKNWNVENFCREGILQ